MAARRFAALAGIVYTLLGLLGFATDHVFGVFHAYPAHNALHLAVGFVGFAGAMLEGLAWAYARVAGLFFLALAVAGVFFPGLFPAMPLGPGDNALHFLTGAIGLYVGYVAAYETGAHRSSRTSAGGRSGRRPNGTRGIR